ncbi:MAG: hypothetical protein WAV90_00440 [Gordonia amarae]
MTTPLYDLAPYVDPDDDARVWCHVEWTPRRGESRCATSDFLDVDDGMPRLKCGIYEAAESLGFPPMMLDDPEHCLRISALVDRQLALSPTARLHCPEGVVVVILTAPWQTAACE